MELSGRGAFGQFLHGHSGPAVHLPRGLSPALPGDFREESIYWINAADPASLCGTAWKGCDTNSRRASPPRHLVYHGPRLVVVSRRYGKELTIHVQPDDPHLHEYLSFFRVLLTREFNPRKQILVERINGIPAGQSPYRKALREFGFQESYKGLELWRRY